MIWTPRKKLITSRHKQRGNIVVRSDADPLFSQVTFLMDCEEAAAGTEAITPTVGPFMNWAGGGGTQPGNFDAEISTVQSKYGGQSIYWKESAGAPNAGWFSLSKVPGTQYGFTGDFTVECDIYILDGTSDLEIFGLWDFTDRQWRWALEGGNNRMNFLTSETGSNNQSPVAQNSWGGATNGIVENQWVHIAVCRLGDDWYAFQDGIASDQTPLSPAAISIFIPTDVHFVIGQQCNGCGAGFVEAYADNLRVTDGTARYTSNFTPPTEAHPKF
jgi:hypothetical protein